MSLRNQLMRTYKCFSLLRNTPNFYLLKKSIYELPQLLDDFDASKKMSETHFLKTFKSFVVLNTVQN